MKTKDRVSIRALRRERDALRTMLRLAINVGDRIVESVPNSLVVRTWERFAVEAEALLKR